jgi:hypothetical protein
MIGVAIGSLTWLGPEVFPQPTATTMKPNKSLTDEVLAMPKGAAYDIGNKLPALNDVT